MDGFGRLVVNGDEVYEESSSAHECWHQESADHHLSDPQFTTKSGVQTAAKKAVYGRRDGVHKNGRIQQRTAPRMQDYF